MRDPVSVTDLQAASEADLSTFDVVIAAGFAVGAALMIVGVFVVLRSRSKDPAATPRSFAWLVIVFVVAALSRLAMTLTGVEPPLISIPLLVIQIGAAVGILLTVWRRRRRAGSGAGGRRPQR